MKIDIAYGRDLSDDILKQLLYLEADAFAYYENLNSDKNNGFIVGAIPTETLNHFKRRVANILFFLKTKNIKHKNTVLGMAWLRLKDYCFHNVYVKPLHRNEGIGKAIVKKAILFARKNKRKMRLSVNPLNDIALHLYKSFGFEFSKNQTVYMVI